MPGHEIKTCPCCASLFECRAGDIVHCQCYGIRLTTAAREAMEEKYDDCLCKNCLAELNSTVTLNAVHVDTCKLPDS